MYSDMVIGVHTRLPILSGVFTPRPATDRQSIGHCLCLNNPGTMLLHVFSSHTLEVREGRERECTEGGYRGELTNADVFI